MLMLLFDLLLAAIALSAISLRKAYINLPLKELKRRARSGDEFAQVLYKAAAYGTSAEVLLWIIIGLSSSGFFIVTALALPAWLALIVFLALVWFGFAWLPKSRSGLAGKTLVKWLTVPLAWLLRQLYPLLSRISDRLVSSPRLSTHTRIYQKEDLIELIKRQKEQTDNRIASEELRIAIGALSFGDKSVSDVMTPRRMIKTVSVTDSIGAHLMDELHASGHSRFPVYQDKADNFVGMLYVKDLLETQHGGRVRDVMHKRVYYIHEQQLLAEVLQAFLKTKHHLFIVINSFEEVVGIITIEDVLEQIIGKPIMDEFDKYDDLRAVAAIKAKAEHQNQVPEKSDNQTQASE